MFGKNLKYKFFKNKNKPFYKEATRDSPTFGGGQYKIILILSSFFFFVIQFLQFGNQRLKKVTNKRKSLEY